MRSEVLQQLLILYITTYSFNLWNSGLDSGAWLSIGLFDSLTTESVELAPAFMPSGFPQGSSMGPLLFNLYMLCLEWINQEYNI